MSGEANTRKPGPPKNPWLRDLIAGKRKWSSSPKTEDPKRGFRGWHERGYLPHRDEPGLTQFVTVRLANSFPESLRSEWEHLFNIEDDRERKIQLEDYLDKGRGNCYLKNPLIAQMVESAFRYFDGKMYELKAWVIMPNHFHILFKTTTTPMSKILENRKKYTAHEANKILGLSGRFWQKDYWDTFMRNEEHEMVTRRYIENNPTKAKIILDPSQYAWTSARYRDAFGKLRR